MDQIKGNFFGVVPLPIPNKPISNVDFSKKLEFGNKTDVCVRNPAIPDLKSSNYFVSTLLVSICYFFCVFLEIFKTFNCYLSVLCDREHRFATVSGLEQYSDVDLIKMQPNYDTITLENDIVLMRVLNTMQKITTLVA